MAESTKQEIAKISKNTDKCSLQKCVFSNEGDKDETLQCRKCHRFVHYGCSQLSAYQIQLCLSFKARSYQCQNCIKVSQNVHDALERSKLFFSCEQGTTNYEKTKRNHINKVGEEIKEKENIERRIDGLENKINKLLAEIKTCKESREEVKTSYAQVTSKQITATNESVRKMIRNKKMEDREIKATSQNLIIHGMVEDVKDTQEREDKLFVMHGTECENQEDTKNPNIYKGETKKE